MRRLSIGLLVRLEHCHVGPAAWVVVSGEEGEGAGGGPVSADIRIPFGAAVVGWALEAVPRSEVLDLEVVPVGGDPNVGFSAFFSEDADGLSSEPFDFFAGYFVSVGEGNFDA